MTIEHGTYGGYQKHKRLGITPCEPCRKANADYHRELRHASGESKGRYLTEMEMGQLAGKLGDFL